MTALRRLVTAPASIVAAIVLVTTAGCASHRYYDGYREDYHAWNGNERGYYNRWEVETRRGHRGYDRRGKDDQRDYWKWRHDH